VWNKKIMVLVDITEDIREGRYSPPLFNNRNAKVFGRRIFVKIGERILVGNIQYMHESQQLIIFVNFNWRKKSDNIGNNTKMLIKTYSVPSGVDIDLFMKRVREEMIKEPQTDGMKWSFDATSLL